MKRLALLALVLAVGCGGSDEVCAIDGKMCSRLSSWGLFDDIATQTPAPGVIPYDLTTPLFSDYAMKDRFVRLPEGQTAGWSDDDPLDLPVGSVLVKTFSFPHDRRDLSQGRRLIETRVLVHGETGWHGAAYVYGDDTDDAKLAVAGDLVDVEWIHDDGSERTNNYLVPNQNQCKLCHEEHDEILTPVGPKVRNLVPDRVQAMVDAGALVGAPPRDQWPQAFDAFDPASGTLDERARQWLDINCGYCHNPRGAARTSGLYLDHAQTDLAKLGVCKAPVATGRGSGNLQYDIVPGNPDQSIIIYRMESTEPEIRMPELGRNLVYEEGVALIREWIGAMTGGCSGGSAGHGDPTSQPTAR
ncbi:MAG TPA: SO2930 family diheme c-type cytochrome [Kofleriaceae bacterium]|nr:SO2930 family diheme c-type cytochrome [Kofleriaceae bacterium]